MSDFDSGELAAVFNGGNVVYSFLSRTYLESVSDSYFAMLNDLLPRVMAMADGENEKLKNGINGLKKFAEERKLLSGKVLNEFDTDVLRDYTRIFCLGGMSVPTSESVYTSLQGIEMQESRDDIRRLFSESKIKISRRSNEPEDHAGNEMHIMAAYYSIAAEALAEQDEKKISSAVANMLYVHEKHFSCWIASFAEKIRAIASKTNFYSHIADFTEGFIAEDYGFLREFRAALPDE